MVDIFWKWPIWVGFARWDIGQFCVILDMNLPRHSAELLYRSVRPSSFAMVITSSINAMAVFWSFSTLLPSYKYVAFWNFPATDPLSARSQKTSKASLNRPVSWRATPRINWTSFRSFPWTASSSIISSRLFHSSKYFSNTSNCTQVKSAYISQILYYMGIWYSLYHIDHMDHMI